MTGTTRVAISTDFLTSYTKLPPQVQGKVTEIVNKFRNNPNSPGINYEKIGSGVDKKIYSVRIDDTYRGIVVREQETGVYLLLWVDHHDEAYAWAAHKRCEVNPKTRSLQIFDVQTVTENAGRETSAKEEAGIFAGAKDEDLLMLGVPEVQLPLVRSLSSKEAFYEAKGSMPLDAFEYLSWLVEGFPMNEVLQLAEEERAWPTSVPAVPLAQAQVGTTSRLLVQRFAPCFPWSGWVV